MTVFRSFEIWAQWGARVETSKALADRLSKTLDALHPLHPLLDSWDWGDAQEVRETEGRGGRHPLAEIWSDPLRAIERNAITDEEGASYPDYGYLMTIVTNRTPPGSTLGFSVSAGKSVRESSRVSAFTNCATFDLGPQPDADFVTYDFWRAAMLVLAETWEVTWAQAWPDAIRPHWLGYPARVAWLNYVSPRFAPLIAPLDIGIVEKRSNGGLFLAATNETFQTKNRDHMAAARKIEAALQPLNKLTWPINDPYL